MKIRHAALVIAALHLSTAAVCSAGSKAPAGILAASVGDSVVLVETSSGLTATLDTGPVGWLFPAPGGVLFAPDVINGRTAVINLRTQTVVDRLDGLTLPNFGANPDRYVAIAGEILLLSYPDRAVIARIDAPVSHPWQVVVTPDNAAAIILERRPDGSAPSHLTTVNLITRQVVYRRPLVGDVRQIALSTQLGLLALADAEADAVHLVEPGSLTPMADRPTPGSPVGVVFAHEGTIMVAAVATADGGGVLDLTHFKTGKKGMRLDKEFSMPLPATPVRIDTSPDGEFVAVAVEGGRIDVIRVGKRELVATRDVGGTPRDLRWCDPTREGPIVPEWSEGEAPTEFGGFAPKIDRDSSSGLEDPGWSEQPN